MVVIPKHYIGKVCEKHPEYGGARCPRNSKCLGCKKEARKKYHNSEKGEVTKAQRRTYYSKQKEVVIKYYGGCCNLCGVTDTEVLTIDHVNNDGAEHRKTVSATQIVSWLVKSNFPDGFRVLCFNCNHKAHLYHNRNQKPLIGAVIYEFHT